MSRALNWAKRASNSIAGVSRRRRRSGGRAEAEHWRRSAEPIRSTGSDAMRRSQNAAVSCDGMDIARTSCTRSLNVIECIQSSELFRNVKYESKPNACDCSCHDIDRSMWQWRVSTLQQCINLVNRKTVRVASGAGPGRATTRNRRNGCAGRGGGRALCEMCLITTTTKVHNDSSRCTRVIHMQTFVRFKSTYSYTLAAPVHVLYSVQYSTRHGHKQ